MGSMLCEVIDNAMATTMLSLTRKAPYHTVLLQIIVAKSTINVNNI